MPVGSEGMGMAVGTLGLAGHLPMGLSGEGQRSSSGTGCSGRSELFSRIPQGCLSHSPLQPPAEEFLKSLQDLITWKNLTNET